MNCYQCTNFLTAVCLLCGGTQEMYEEIDHIKDARQLAAMEVVSNLVKIEKVQEEENE